MTIHRILLVAIVTLIAGVPSARASDLRPAVVPAPSGTLHIQQNIPCGGHIDQTTPVTAGRIELAPADGVDVAGGGKQFALTRVTLTFAPFSASGSCLGVTETRNYTEVGVELDQALALTGVPAGGGVFNVTIPHGDVWLREASVVDGGLESGLQQPSEDVIATIDLTRGIVTLHVVVATSVHFQSCVGLICVIDETDPGVLTADVSGTLAFPDTDRDGVPDRADNCRFVPNPDQTPIDTPVVTPPPAVTLASCEDHAIGSAIAADVCDGGPVAIDNDAPARFAIGSNVVTWTARAASGRVRSATQVVTIRDGTSPTFTSVPLDLVVGDCGPVSLGIATAVDDCAGAPSITSDAPASFGAGATHVTWTATDVSGNATHAFQTVTVRDLAPPAVSCIPVGPPPAHAFQVSASDACGGALAIRLGAYLLANGERIKIEETGGPNVRFIGTVGPDRIRHFQVPGREAIVRATDAAGNTATAICR